MRRNQLFLSLALVAVALVACRKDRPGGGFEDPNTPGGSDPATQARDVFVQRCAACHGPAGMGDGPASASLTPRPRNFHDPAWQRSTSDDAIERIIRYGGPAVGKSALMPANPDLQNRPAVVSALRAQIRAMAP